MVALGLLLVQIKNYPVSYGAVLGIPFPGSAVVPLGIVTKVYYCNQLMLALVLG
jgi:hypothetical protein